MTEMSYAQAACLALCQEMERDPLVWALGEDLAPEGGVAGQYLGLQEIFGRERIVATPISESMIMAAGVGAAITGTRPVVELRYCDFGYCAADEIINQAAKIRYMSGGQVRVPVVIRMSIGMRESMAAQHSQSNEALWAGVPGLVVIAPSSPADLHALLKASVRADDPVMFLEHKELWTTRGEVDENAPPAEIGKAAVCREGSDLTIVSWSNMVAKSLLAAESLHEQGVSVEVIDLRTLYPWDRQTVFGSVRKTGRVMVVNEAIKIGGWGGEIVSEIAENAFDALKAKPMRLGTPRTPVPFSKVLETPLRIQVDTIAQACLHLMGRGA